MTKEEFATRWTIYYRSSLLSVDDFRDMRQRMIDFLNLDPYLTIKTVWDGNNVQ